MWAVFKRELRAYFLSFLGYSFVGFFLLVAGYYFAYQNLYIQDTNFPKLFSSITTVFMVLVPILTMRLMAEERKQKTDQLLLTAPLSITAMVTGKYLAAVGVFFITLVITLVYPVILLMFANVSIPLITTSYIGFFLLGCCFIAVGLFISSLSENQITAAVATFAALLLLSVLDMLSPSIPIPALVTALNWISLMSRYTDFALGELSITPILYYLSFCGFFLFLTVRAVEKRRWSEG